MTKTRAIPFTEFRAFLQRLGYAEARTDNAIVFNHPEEGLLVFRLYRDDEAVDARDLFTTRKFLDLRGLLPEAEFDTLLFQATPA
jgi:hypothetical protein